SEQTARPSLPPLQIPKFKGQPWEWDQFWGIFSSVVDSRRISKIEKLNYLIEALQGPARDAVQDLQITEAIDLLKNRFGSQDAIVGRLLSSMQTLNSRTTRLSDQRRILDKIASIVSQLRQKGEAVDTEQMKRTILGKFSEKIQRSVLKRRKSSSESWTTQDLLNELSNYFATEDDIQYCMGTVDDTGSKGRRTTEVKTPYWMNNPKAPKTMSSKQFPCFYCHRTDHIPINCKEFSTYAQRIEQMQRRNLCRNCGASSHSTHDCTRGDIQRSPLQEQDR
ncbi:unnamed protein product, partial [Nippostrongylus brasiliensis]|uniref:CCHC-type domain-containing protein n=1 Tax=Nippostrongylus brasiliensis TaxID=27835 RepID=A0A0N4XP19_NIPBR